MKLHLFWTSPRRRYVKGAMLAILTKMSGCNFACKIKDTSPLVEDKWGSARGDARRSCCVLAKSSGLAGAGLLQPGESRRPGGSSFGSLPGSREGSRSARRVGGTGYRSASHFGRYLRMQMSKLNRALKNLNTLNRGIFWKCRSYLQFSWDSWRISTFVDMTLFVNVWDALIKIWRGKRLLQ